MDNKDLNFENLEELSLEDLFGDEPADETSFLDEENIEMEAEPVIQAAEITHGNDTKKEKKVSWQKSALLYLHDLIFLLAGIIVAFLLCFRVMVVSGTSMNNTLLDGDYLLLISNVFYQNPRQGDVIVASKDSFDNGAPIVKRVIATAGQWVDIDFNAGTVSVGDSLENMHLLEEPYTLTPTNLYEGINFPVQVQEGCIFVMGDNRNDSKDSRNPQIGQIDCREVLGKVVFLFMPGTNDGEYARDFGRIGMVS